MQSTLRTSIAAAALLLPLSALFVAQPAAAQNRGHDRPARVEVRDRHAPRILQVTPAQSQRVGDRGRTEIAARYSDQGSGVAPRSVTLRVDGRDVTRHARVDYDDIRYAGNLRPGRHVAQLTVRDRAGNTTQRSWSFHVVDEQRQARGWGFGVAQQLRPAGLAAPDHRW
jgi:hypothetical protein